MAKTKLWQPEEGQVYKSRDELEQKLLEAGYQFEGHGTGLSESGKPIGYDIGVIDGELWLWIDLKPCRERVQVTKVKELQSTPKQLRT